MRHRVEHCKNSCCGEVCQEALFQGCCLSKQTGKDGCIAHLDTRWTLCNAAVYWTSNIARLWQASSIKRKIVKCGMKEQKVMHAIITCKVSSVHGQVPARGAGIATTLLPLVCCVRFKGCLSQTPAKLEGRYGSNCHQHLELWHLTPQWVTDQTLIPAVSNRSCALNL